MAKSEPAPEEPTFDIGKTVAAMHEIVERARPFVAALEQSNSPRGLYAKLARIQLEIEDVPRAGHAEVRGKTKAGNEFTYSYDYILEADLMKAVRPLLARYGIATFYSDRILKRPEAGDAATIVEVSLTLVDGETGQQERLTAEGYAVDFGDKGANKAKTSAVRYILWKTFLQPSDEDPEQETQNAEQAAQRRQVTEQAQMAQQQAGRAPASAGGARRTTQGGPDNGGLIQRINQLAVELDEVQGLPPGRTIGTLQDLAQQEHGIPVADFDNAALVKIGTALAQHLTEERQHLEQQGTSYVPTEFTLPR